MPLTGCAFALDRNRRRAWVIDSLSCVRPLMSRKGWFFWPFRFGRTRRKHASHCQPGYIMFFTFPNHNHIVRISDDITRLASPLSGHLHHFFKALYPGLRTRSLSIPCILLRYRRTERSCVHVYPISPVTDDRRTLTMEPPIGQEGKANVQTVPFLACPNYLSLKPTIWRC